MQLSYFAADTLGMTLYQIKDTLVAKEIHPMALGPWRLELPVEADSDILSTMELGFWVTLGQRLHLYVVIREKENWLFVLDETSLKACGAETGFTGQTVKDRVLEFKSAIRGVFRWRGSEWIRMEYDGSTHGRGDAHNLVQDTSRQGAGEPLLGTQ